VVARRVLATCVVAASAALAGGSVRAAELLPGAETDVRYDSNVSRVEHDPDQDGILDVGPTVRLREQQQPLHYDVFYHPSWLQYFTHGGLSTWQHYARAQGGYDLGERTGFTFDDSFYYSPSVVESFINSGGAANPTSTVGSEKYLLNDVQLGASHLFTPRLRGSIQLQNSLFDPTNNDRTSSISWSANSDLLYALTPSNRVGGGLGFNLQKYEPSLQPSSRTRFYQAYGTWVHDIDATWNFSVSAGPTLIVPEDTSFAGASVQANPIPVAGLAQTYVTSTCPTQGGVPVFQPAECRLSPPGLLDAELQAALINAGLSPAAAQNEAHSLEISASQPVVLTNTGGGGSSSNQITYFAAASMTKSWRDWRAVLSYTRNAGSSSGYGTSNVLDTVSLVTVFEPSPVWYFSLTARFDQRATASSQSVLVATVNPAGASFASSVGTITIPDVVTLSGLTTVKLDSSEQLRDYAVLLYGQRQLTKHLTVFLQGSYYTQKAQGKVSAENNYNDAIVSVGVRYELEPIHIPFL